MNELFNLSGKVALVTGAAGYLGTSIAYGLAQAGAKVYINGRSSEKLEALKKNFVLSGGEIVVSPFNIVNEGEISEFFSNLKEDTLDILVNNAYSGKAGTIETASSEEYRETYEVAVVASQNLLKNSLPYLRTAKKLRGDASVINIASMYGMVSPDIRIYESKEASNPPFYGAAKSALLQWTRYAACEFAKEGIRINSISPGPFPSDLVQNSNPDLVRKISQKVPMGRIGNPDELIGAIVFLASSASTYVTGANIPVDGGWTAW